MSLKREELYRHSYHSENELKKCVEDYIGFYNNERPHAALGNKTPNAFENLYYEWQRTKKSRQRGSEVIFCVFLIEICNVCKWKGLCAQINASQSP